MNQQSDQKLDFKCSPTSSSPHPCRQCVMSDCSGGSRVRYEVMTGATNLCQYISALLQQWDRGVAETGRQLHSQQLFLLDSVAIDSVKQCNGSEPRGQRVNTEETSTKQLACRDGVHWNHDNTVSTTEFPAVLFHFQQPKAAIAEFSHNGRKQLLCSSQDWLLYYNFPFCH